MMKMSTKKFGMLALLVVLVIGVVFISGCVEAPEVTTHPDEIGPPTLDVIGNDIPDVPRYPGSVRTSYSHMGDERDRITAATYITSASVDEVLRFYKKELPVNGWIDIGEMYAEETFTLIGHKEGANVMVSISPDEFYPNHTLILIWISRRLL